MKPLPLLVVTVAVSACASQPMPPSAQSVGESQQPVAAVSQCIAQKWANQSQQTSHIAGDCGEQPGDGRLCSGAAASEWRSRSRAAVVDG